jgi:hypothetical protein
MVGGKSPPSLEWWAVRMSVRLTGQILRIAGLLIEMIGILTFGLRTRADVPLPSLLRQLSTDSLWILIGVGFATWLLGSILTYWPRPKARAENSSPKDDDALKL